MIETKRGRIIAAAGIGALSLIAFKPAPVYATPTCSQRVNAYCEQYWETGGPRGSYRYASFDECVEQRMNLDCPPDRGPPGEDPQYPLPCGPGMISTSGDPC